MRQFKLNILLLGLPALLMAAPGLTSAQVDREAEICAALKGACAAAASAVTEDDDEENLTKDVNVRGFGFAGGPPRESSVRQSGSSSGASPATRKKPRPAPKPGQKLGHVEMQITFDTGSAELTETTRKALDDYAAALNKDSLSQFSVSIEGYTDSVGPYADNLDLSQRRAQAVVSYLVQNGKVAASRLSAKGHGEARPVASNGSESGRSRNRRVELVVKAAVS